MCSRQNSQIAPYANKTVIAIIVHMLLLMASHNWLSGTLCVTLPNGKPVSCIQLHHFTSGTSVCATQLPLLSHPQYCPQLSKADLGMGQGGSKREGKFPGRRGAHPVTKLNATLSSQQVGYYFSINGTFTSHQVHQASVSHSLHSVFNALADFFSNGVAHMDCAKGCVLRTKLGVNANLSPGQEI